MENWKEQLQSLVGPGNYAAAQSRLTKVPVYISRDRKYLKSANDGLVGAYYPYDRKWRAALSLPQWPDPTQSVSNPNEPVPTGITVVGENAPAGVARHEDVHALLSGLPSAAYTSTGGAERLGALADVDPNINDHANRLSQNYPVRDLFGEVTANLVQRPHRGDVNSFHAITRGLRKDYPEHSSWVDKLHSVMKSALDVARYGGPSDPNDDPAVASFLRAALGDAAAANDMQFEYDRLMKKLSDNVRPVSKWSVFR